ncbi:gamete antigen 27/25, putative [Plasmodium gallinaceum]|uniref:Gamete antigen 27/25, putative n=1 Tax=Plasmodium gallinaceum TaxID=5849 RepID=A0A1J1GU57_PLAGA|nr:gamete antigen 27/25, putative [Plasmodium gallinaceum]CRG96065.1 gamete antigen 27/25, putative [Plasmodium gallinaceum]
MSKINITRECQNFTVNEELRDNMTFRIQNRFSDYCLDVALTDEYCLKLKNIFSIEQQAFEEVFLDIHKKKIINEKLHNSAVRIGKFVNDFNFLSLTYSKVLPIVPDDHNIHL